MATSPTPREARRSFAGTTASIGEARRFVRETVADVADRAELVGDLELAVSELVTNAVEHGLAEPLTVNVVVTADPPSVGISVRSVRSSSGIADPSTWSGPLPAVRTGRGLAIVRAVSDAVSVDADDETVTVHCTFRI